MSRRDLKKYLSKEILREIWDCGLQEDFQEYAKIIKHHRYISGKELDAVLKAIRLVKTLIPEKILVELSPQKRFSEWYREVH